MGGGVEDLLDSMDVASERRDHNLATRPANHAIDDRSDLRLRVHEPGDLSIRRIAHEKIHALFAGGGEGTQIGKAPVNRQLIHLEIAGNEEVTFRGAHEHRERVGNGVIDGNELEFHPGDREGIAFFHHAGMGFYTMLL